MTQSTPADLPLISDTDSGCCGGSGCNGGTSADVTESPSRPTSSNEKGDRTGEQSLQEFQVSGMTCGHCATAVTGEVEQLAGVSEVAVDLVAGGVSTVRVTGTEPVDPSAVAAALAEAGDYELV